MLSGEADIPAATKIISGSEKAFTSIASEMDRLNAQRAFLVTGKSLGAGPLVSRLKDGLGDRLVGHFSMGEHSPRSTVLAGFLEERY